MKRALILSMLAAISLLFISAVRDTTADKPQIYAVVVGVSRYNDPSITFLKYAHRDAEAYRSFLESPQGGGVEPENIVLLTNERATRSAIIKGLRDMFNRATEEDVVVFFFSGHGVPDPKAVKDVYLTTYDTDDENYTGTALLKDDVARQFSNSKAKLKLFFADACHSGGSGIYLGVKDDGAELVNKYIATIASIKEPGWAAITASSSSEKSFEDAKWGGGHGIFTYQLIQGLSGAADKTTKENARSKGNGDGIVTIRELFDYLSNAIPAETDGKQHPDKQSKNEDVFPVSAVNADKYATAIAKYKKPAVTRDDTGSGGASGLINKDEMRKYDTETRDMKPGICATEIQAFGTYCFVNNYGEDILLTGASGGRFNLNRINIMIAAGGVGCLERVEVSYINNRIIAEPSQTITFYFRTIDENKPIKYGTRKLVLEACKEKTEVLTKQNLYLSADGERY